MAKYAINVENQRIANAMEALGIESDELLKR